MTWSDGINMVEESRESLVVTSKVKSYIKTVGDMRCSVKFIEHLSERVKKMCEEAVQNALNEQRRTILEKDLL